LSLTALWCSKQMCKKSFSPLTICGRQIKNYTEPSVMLTQMTTKLK
jgi:hypothetical protein